MFRCVLLVARLVSFRSVCQFVGAERCVVDADCHNTFALITKRIGEKEKERMYVFCITEPASDSDKEDFLTCLSKAICSNMCRTDYVSFYNSFRYAVGFLETFVSKSD